MRGVICTGRRTCCGTVRRDATATSSKPFVRFVLRRVLGALGERRNDLVSRRGIVRIQSGVQSGFKVDSRRVVRRVRHGPTIALSRVTTTLSIAHHSVRGGVGRLHSTNCVEHRKDGGSKH